MGRPGQDCFLKGSILATCLHDAVEVLVRNGTKGDTTLRSQSRLNSQLFTKLLKRLVPGVGVEPLT